MIPDCEKYNVISEYNHVVKQGTMSGKHFLPAPGFTRVCIKCGKRWTKYPETFQTTKIR